MPISGSWRVSYSHYSEVDSGEINLAFIYLNGEPVPESRYYTYINGARVISTGGREVTLEASAGDTITLHTSALDRYIAGVLTCFSFIPTM